MSSHLGTKPSSLRIQVDDCKMSTMSSPLFSHLVNTPRGTCIHSYVHLDLVPNSQLIYLQSRTFRLLLLSIDVEYGLEYNTGKDEESVVCPQGCGIAIQQILS